MKWILCGKNDAAVECLELLLERGDEVRVVANAGDDGQDGWQRSLRAAAARRGLSCDQPGRINHPDFVAQLAGFGASALISIQYDQILRGPLLSGVGCPCLNLHFALLPRHRGVAPIAWAILCGDREAGVTLHHMVEAIDAGDVIAQRAVPIGAEESARELYDRVSAAAVELFRHSHPFPRELLRQSLPQDDTRASYHRQGDLDFSKRRVDWKRPAAELQRWLRAMIFPPLQHPETGRGTGKLEITRVAGTLAEAGGAEPGTVIARDDGRIDVAAGGAALGVLSLRDPARPELDSKALFGSIRLGERLDSGGMR